MSNVKTTAKKVSAKKVTVIELGTILSNVTVVKGMACIAHVEQLTKPKLTKKDRDTKEPFMGQIHKYSKVAIILNTEYETVVTNQLKKENKDTAEYEKGRNTMPIEKCENNNFFGYFNDKGVLEYKPNQGVKPSVAYYLNGKLTDKAILPNVLPVSSVATNQGTEKEISWRKLYITNIVAITLNGCKYEVIK